MNPGALTLVVLLFVDPAREAELERYEQMAAEIMRRYGGKIERRIRLTADGDPSRPQEVHIVTFPDQGSFDRYRRDPELAALAGLRGEAIRETIVWSGVDAPPFSAG